jgi:hypothetical protein
MGMTYDAARGEVVVFGGFGIYPHHFGDTWTWDGATWTKQHPAISPSARDDPGMAYDTLRGEVVLFGGRADSAVLNDTWTWDGVNWTKQHPATVPPVRVAQGMAYDALRGVVVMFGGYQGCFGCLLHDTWTWDGVNWTEQHPTNWPSERSDVGMTYDALRGEVVLFGGVVYYPSTSNETWTWDGANWTEESPPTTPRARGALSMAYDDLRGEVVMFGGTPIPGYLRGTWVWDGGTWKRRHPTNRPSGRAGSDMAYDASTQKMVLFGGGDATGPLGDTWMWDGKNWAVPFVAHLHLSPNSGPPGTVVQVNGTGFAAFEKVTLTFIDSVNGKTDLGTFTTDGSGKLAAQVTVPANATTGAQKVSAVGAASDQKASAKFTVT